MSPQYDFIRIAVVLCINITSHHLAIRCARQVVEAAREAGRARGLTTRGLAPAARAGEARRHGNIGRVKARRARGAVRAAQISRHPPRRACLAEGLPRGGLEATQLIMEK